MIAYLFWLFVGCIFYVYVGYPFILGLLARLFYRPGTYTCITPSLTIVIPAYNEEQVIKQKLDNCFCLDYPQDKVEVLVVADGSTDQTCDIVTSYPKKKVRLIHRLDRRGKMAAVNRAIPFINSEIVVFSDANNMYARDALRELVAPFSDARVGGVSGAKRIVKGDGPLGESEGLYWRYESFIKKQEARVGSCVAVVGEIFAIKRDLFLPCPEYIINDDAYMAMRLLKQGYNIAYAEQALSIERVSLSAREELIRRSRIVAGRYQIFSMIKSLFPWRRPIISWMLVSHKLLRPFVAVAMIGALAANIALVVRPPGESAQTLVDMVYPYNVVSLALQAMFYSLAVLGIFMENGGTAGKVFYLPKFLVCSNFSALIGLFRYFRKSQSPAWDRVRRRDVL